MAFNFEEAKREGGQRVDFPAVYIHKDTKEFYMNGRAAELVARNNSNKLQHRVVVFWDNEAKVIGLTFHNDLAFKGKNNYRLTGQHAAEGNPYPAMQFCCSSLMKKIQPALLKVMDEEGRFDGRLEECTEPDCEPTFIIRLQSGE